MRIGIDIGGVLIGKRQDNNALFDVPDSLSSLRHLSSENSLYIISYSKKRMAQANYYSLVESGLFDAQYYVDTMSYKSLVVKHLGCNVMIDDKENILNEVKFNNPDVLTILFQRYNKQKKRSHRKHQLVESWSEVIDLLKHFQGENFSVSDEEERDYSGDGYFISQLSGVTAGIFNPGLVRWRYRESSEQPCLNSETEEQAAVEL